VTYDPEATCPNWLECLDKITNKNDELIAYLQRKMGYMLTGSVREEVLFIAHGDGKNGKSTYRETLHELLGDYAIVADAGLLLERRQAGSATPEVARLKGRRLVCINETSENDRLNEARVKFITSIDTITARKLYRDPFDFKPTHKAMLTTNHTPIIRGTDEGIWRRIHLLPFTVTIPAHEVKRDYREEELRPELPGILNWALDGLKAYREIGLAPPDTVRGATEKYRRDMDVFTHWLQDRCVVEPGASVPATDAYADYARWAKDDIGWVMSQNRFGRSLTEKGFTKDKVGGRRVIKGLRLKPLPPEDAAEDDNGGLFS
jgi:putative DNA primase/helicase